MAGVLALPRRLWDRYGDVLESGYPVPVSVLSVYRIAFATYLLVLNAIPDLRWIASYPDVFYDPAPGLPSLWLGFPPFWVLLALELLLIAAVCALLVGWRTPMISLTVTVIGLTANSAYFTFGKIDHTFMTWILPGLLAFSGWGRLYSVDAVRDGPADEGEVAPSWPVVAVGAMLGLSFLTAALPKILRGWLSFETSAVRRNFLKLHAQLDRNAFVADSFIDFEFRPFWEALDWAGVGLEFTGALVLLWPLAQRWLIFAAAMFHLANLLLLNISFFGPLPVYPLFFLPLLSPAVGATAGRWLMARRRWLLIILPGLAVTAMFGRGLWWTLTRDVIGLPGRWSHLVFFLIAFSALLVLTIRTGGFRRVIGV